MAVPALASIWRLTSRIALWQTHETHESVGQDGLHLDPNLFGQLLRLLISLQQSAQLALFAAQRLVVGEPVEGDPKRSLLRNGVKTDEQGVTRDPLDLGRSVIGVLVLGWG
jgi:hypothetical protein